MLPCAISLLSTCCLHVVQGLSNEFHRCLRLSKVVQHKGKGPRLCCQASKGTRVAGQPALNTRVCLFVCVCVHANSRQCSLSLGVPGGWLWRSGWRWWRTLLWQGVRWLLLFATPWMRVGVCRTDSVARLRVHVHVQPEPCGPGLCVPSMRLNTKELCRHKASPHQVGSATCAHP